MSTSPTQSDIDPNEECTTCRGKFKDHVDSRHPFTRAGESAPRTDFLNQKHAQQSTPSMQWVTNASFVRLLGVLRDKGLIDDRDVANVVGIPSFKEPM